MSPTRQAEVLRVVEQRYMLSLHKMRGVDLCLEPGKSKLRPARSTGLLHLFDPLSLPGRMLERIREGELLNLVLLFQRVSENRAHQLGVTSGRRCRNRAYPKWHHDLIKG
jgi:hypothetical protein